jgi:ribosomal biogenesis protein LAS1
MQYSLAVVRMVNGIADSSQKGRMAASVASLTAAAGLPRLLVDLRHEATHNELPSLAALQLAAHHALTWLRINYWEKQKDHVELNKTKISGIVGDYIASHMAAAIKAAAAAQKQDYDSDEDDDDQDNNNGVVDGNGDVFSIEYNVAEARKQRQALLTELRVAVPAPATYLLIDGLLQAQVAASRESSSSSSSSSSAAASVVVVRALTHAMKHLLQEGWIQLPAILLDTAAVALGKTVEEHSAPIAGPAAPRTSTAVAISTSLLAADWELWLQVLAPEGKVNISETAARSIIATSLLSLSEIEQAPLNRWLRNSSSASPDGGTNNKKKKTVAAKEMDAQRVSALKKLLEVTFSCVEGSKELQQRCLAAASRVQGNSNQPATASAAAEAAQPNVELLSDLQRLSYEVLNIKTSTSSKRERSLEENGEEKEETKNKKQRWTLSQNWQPCAIGMLPSAVDSNGKIPRLELRKGFQLRDLPKEDVSLAAATAGEEGGGRELNFGSGGGAGVAMSLGEEEEEEEELDGNSDDYTVEEEEEDMLDEEEEGLPLGAAAAAASASGRCPPPSAVRPRI